MGELRPYQERAIESLRGSFRRGRRAPCLVLPTGAGKTVVAAAIVSGAVARGGRVLFLAHRRELITQSVGKLRAAGIHDIRTIQAGTVLGSPTAAVTVASIPTIKNWTGRMPAADLVIFDEAHHASATTWAGVAASYASANLLGLTATPERADGAPLGDIFDDLVVGASVAELTELGHLVPCQVLGPAAKLGTAELVVSPAEAYLKHADGERAVVFCSTLEHCKTVAAEMNARGVPAAVVDGRMPKADRQAALARFGAGDVRAIVCVHVLTEGWDDPGVGVCILARQPGHAGTYLQMVGRVLRPHPGKTRALVLDLCGSSLKHGPPSIERVYSLEGRAISGGERLAIRQCLECGAVYEGDACSTCGATHPKAKPKTLVAVGGELVDVAAKRAWTYEVPIVSKYAGRCSRCQHRYEQGTLIYWTKGRAFHRHQRCPSAGLFAEAP